MKIEIDTYPDNAVIRAWAWQNGFMPADFGPVPLDVHTAFRAALQAAVQEAAERFIAEANTPLALVTQISAIEALGAS